MYKNCVITIVTHKPNPSEYELISFQQCFKVLGNYPIKIVVPQNLNLDVYKSYVPNFNIIYVDPKWLSSVLNYNKLKLSQYFYSLFNEYDYLLTYELDAFVFKDELQYWCTKEYDYIGAPWFEGYSGATADAQLLSVGNSGFSLRKIKSMQQLIRKMFYKEPIDNATYFALLRAYSKRPYHWVRNQLGENYTIQKFCNVNEDIIISERAHKGFKLAPIDEALKFSFEANPAYLFKLNNENLPMGCHAWWKYDFDFWKPFMDIL